MVSIYARVVLLAIDVNVQVLSELLARYPARFQPLSSLESLGGGGGLSGARLWRFRAEHGMLLLRAWPSHGPGRSHIEQVHQWLAASADLGFVPGAPSRSRWPILSGMERHVLGSHTLDAGVADWSHPPKAEHLRLAFTGLAAFHQRLVHEQAEGVSAGLRQRHHEISQLLAAG